MRHAVIGDVGGHLDSLRTELARLGADVEAALLPEDLVVIQLGDLVHRGPHSEAVVALVDRFLRANQGRWIQLVGNHEAQYLRHPAFAWRDWIDPVAQQTLREWWAGGAMVAAAVLPTEDGDVLVTHAGITEEFWRRDLGSAPTARGAAQLLNELAARDDNVLFRSGMMLTGGRPNHRAGPLWAQASRELLGSWQGHRLPFSQVHGHSSCYDWEARAWRDGAPVASTVLDERSRHETTWFDGGYIVGVDPDHGEAPQPHWYAWSPPSSADSTVELLEDLDDAAAPAEEALGGGNASGEVVRVGGTIRKPWLGTTGYTARYLAHLAAAGIDVPRVRGRDEQGRAVIDFVPGRMAIEQVPLELGVVRRVGELVARIHRASESFELPGPWPVLLPAPHGQRLVCHNDLASWNLVIDGERLVFIDWDGAGPSSQAWDLAYAAISFAHLFPDAVPSASACRLAAFLDGYGADEELREHVVEQLAPRAKAMWQLLHDAHQRDEQPWGAMYVEGHGEHWAATARFIEANLELWRSAACEPQPPLAS